LCPAFASEKLISFGVFNLIAANARENQTLGLDADFEQIEPVTFANDLNGFNREFPLSVWPKPVVWVQRMRRDRESAADAAKVPRPLLAGFLNHYVIKMIARTNHLTSQRPHAILLGRFFRE